jgi:hypothetical protein
MGVAIALDDLRPGNDRTRQSDVAPRRVQHRVESSLNADLFFLMTPAVRSPPRSKATKRQRRKPAMPVERICMLGLSLCSHLRLQAY